MSLSVLNSNMSDREVKCINVLKGPAVLESFEARSTKPFEIYFKIDGKDAAYFVVEPAFNPYSLLHQNLNIVFEDTLEIVIVNLTQQSITIDSLHFMVRPLNTLEVQNLIYKRRAEKLKQRQKTEKVAITRLEALLREMNKEA